MLWMLRMLREFGVSLVMMWMLYGGGRWLAMMWKLRMLREVGVSLVMMWMLSKVMARKVLTSTGTRTATLAASQIPVCLLPLVLVCMLYFSNAYLYRRQLVRKRMRGCEGTGV